MISFKFKISKYLFTSKVQDLFCLTKVCNTIYQPNCASCLQHCSITESCICTLQSTLWLECDSNFITISRPPYFFCLIILNSNLSQFVALKIILANFVPKKNYLLELQFSLLKKTDIPNLINIWYGFYSQLGMWPQPAPTINAS